MQAGLSPATAHSESFAHAAAAGRAHPCNKINACVAVFLLTVLALPFPFFVSFFVPFWHHVGSILSLGGDLETPPGEPRGTFVPHLPPGTLPNAILGSFWTPLGNPFGALSGPVFGFGPPLEALGKHFGVFWAAFGPLSVSTCIWDPKKHRKTSFSGVPYVPET